MADATGRAESARRERPFRRPGYRPRRPAGPASPLYPGGVPADRPAVPAAGRPAASACPRGLFRSWTARACALVLAAAAGFAATAPAQAQSNDATLSALAVTGNDSNTVTLSPAFASNEGDYTASVADNIWRLTFAPATTNANATVGYYLNGASTARTDADTNATGFQIDPDVGENVIEVRVTAQDGITTESYEVTVTRAQYMCEAPDFSGAQEVLAADMRVGIGSGYRAGTIGFAGVGDPTDFGRLSERSFNLNGNPYRVNTLYFSTNLAVNKLTLETRQDWTSQDVDVMQLHICGDTFAGRSADFDRDFFAWAADHPLWSPGITVSVAVSRVASRDAALSGLALQDHIGGAIALSTPFVFHETGYTASVANGVSRITITPTARANTSRIQYRDGHGNALADLDPLTDGHQVALAAGTNTIQVEVTAEDGTMQTYTVEVTRAGQSDGDATLRRFELSEGVLSPVFASDVTTYTAAVANAVSEITVTVAKTDSAATVEFLDGDLNALADVNTVRAGHQVDLVAGENEIQVAVTAGNGIATKIYALTVTRAAPSDTDATLRSLTVERLDGIPFTLSPAFDPDTLAYTMTLQLVAGELYDFQDTRITPWKSDPAATVEWKRESVSSDLFTTVSGGFQTTLDGGGGDDPVEMRVTAGDGLTTKTYTLVDDIRDVEPEAACVIPDLSNRTEVWSAVMTPGTSTQGSGYSPNPTLGALSDTTFEYHGNVYVVQQVWDFATNFLPYELQMRLDEALPNSDQQRLRLHVCGATFELAGVSPISFAGSTRYVWENAGLDWSDGSTILLALSAENAPPEFEDAGNSELYRRYMPEYLPADMDIGAPVTATDPDGDTLVYSLEGSYASNFHIDPDTGQLRTRAGRTFTVTTSDPYTVEVTARDGNGGTARIDVDVYVAITLERPVVQGSSDDDDGDADIASLSVTWTTRSSTSAHHVEGYDLRYRQAGTSVWTEYQNPEAISSSDSATIIELLLGRAYEVQVRVYYTGGGRRVVGPWSESGYGTTGSAASGRPDISGGLQVGNTLTALLGTITDPDGTSRADAGESGYAYRYEWIRVTDTQTVISGATSDTYTLADDDVDASIRVRVRFTDDDDNPETVTSSAVGPVISPPSPPRPPVIIGNCVEDYFAGADWCTTLDVGTGAESGLTSYGYRRGDAGFGSIGNETITYGDASYIIEQVVLDVGTDTRTVTVETSGVRVANDSSFFLGGTRFDDDEAEAYGATGYRWDAPADFVWREDDSVSVSVELGDFAPRGRPAITGIMQVGQELTATISDITDNNGRTKADNGDPGNAWTYQWVRVDGGNQTDIAGATASTYLLSDADAGKKVRVRVRFADDETIIDEECIEDDVCGWDYRSSHAFPMRFAGVAGRDAGGVPVITGVVERGGTLTALQGTIADADGLPATFPDDYTFQWVRVDGSIEADIPGATSQTYLLTNADVDKTIKVRVGFTDGGGNTETRVSGATVLVYTPLTNPCPAASDWCATMFAGVQPTDPLVRGYADTVASPYGSLNPAGPIEYGGLEWQIVRLVYDHESPAENRTLELQTRRAIPYDSVLKLDERQFWVNAGSDNGLSGSIYTYSWQGFHLDGDEALELLAAGQRAAVSLRFGNFAAAGEPGITGAAQVGGELTATTSDITDTDGKTKADNGDAGHAWTYQWVRVDGTVETDIMGATQGAYTPVADDEGKQVKVKVEFTDDDDNGEGPLASDATAVVARAAESCADDRPGHDWCATMTVGASATLGNGYSEGVFGMLAEPGIDYRGETPAWTVQQIRTPTTTPATVEVTLDKHFDPDEAVFDLGGTEFTADASTQTADPGGYSWTPADFVWTEGQQVTVSANLAPGLTDATVDGTSLVLTYAEDLDTGSIPAAGKYTVTADGTEVAVSAVEVGTRKVTLTLAASVNMGQTVSLTYAVVAGESAVRDASGLDAPALDAHVVTNTTVISPEATLSGLAVNDGTNDLTLSPAFTSDGLFYTASVATTVGQVTVTPEQTHASATVEYLDAGGAEYPDADADDTNGLQAGLADGANIILVRVTAQDTTSMLTYQVTVTRGPTTCSSGIAVLDQTADADLVTDCETLLGLRDTLDGDDVGGLNWDAATAMTEWDGVGLSPSDSSRRVINLSLSNKSLTGEIPVALAGLTALTSLTLSRNTLTGEIPAALGNLTMLTNLELNDNRLTGTIPVELGKLAALNYLALSGNMLDGSIPADLGNFEALESLFLNGNALTGTIPKELVKLTGLENLWLHNNKLTGCVPAQFIDYGANVSGQQDPDTLAAVTLADCAIIAEAGDGADVTGGEIVTLQGSASGHLTGVTLKYLWAADTTNSDATDAMLSALDIFNPVFTAPAATAAEQTFTFALTVTDDEATSGEGTDSVTYTLPAATVTNTPATGEPAIDGTPQEGGMLTALIGTLADADDLPTTAFPAGYTFQWLRVAGGVDTEITGATGSTYTPVAADIGAALKVTVGFTDGGNTTESRTSLATAAVVRAAQDCTSDRPGHDWCETMTVGTDGFNHGYRVGGSPIGLLTEPTIAYHGLEWEVGTVVTGVQGGMNILIFVTDAALPPNTEITVGGTTYNTNDRGGVSTTYTWSEPLGTFGWLDGQEVTVSANIAPLLESAEVDGTSLALTYYEALDTNSVPDKSAYTVKADGSAGPAVESVAVSGGEVTLTLASAVTSGQTVTVTYTVPASNPVQDASGHAAVGLDDESVTNSTGNTDPAVANPIADQEATVGTSFNHTFPENTFSDADGHTLSYTATQDDDSTLPSWLAFVEATRTFSGTPGAGDTGTVTVKVTADDSNGGTVSDTFDIVVSAAADTTAPTVLSIERHDPSASPTNADSLTWRVTFSEDVKNVDAADFALSGTSAPLGVTAVTGSESQYDVKAMGGDLADLTATVTLSFAAGQNIADKANNTLEATTPAGTDDSAWELDNTAPAFVSAMANGAALDITFDEDLAAAPNLANTAFEVKKTASGTETTAALGGTPSIGGRTVTLTLATALTGDDSAVKVTYTPPASGTDNTLRDATGNAAAGFTDQAVTNNTAVLTCSSGIAVPNPAANPLLVADCQILLEARDTLDGSNTGGLSWSAATAMINWHGVSGVSSVRRVKSLILSGNSLTGTIPAALGDLDALEVLNLTGGALTGPVPAALGGLDALEELNLSGNALTGPIPAALGNLSKLEELDLSGNGANLGGDIPASLGDLGALQKLNLSGNALTGTIPASLGNLEALEELDLGAQTPGLTGSIPAVLGDLDKMQDLQLNDNALDGAIPASLGALPKLDTLDLSRNDLTGAIPAALVELPSLKILFLNLHNNTLTGCVPDQFVTYDTNVSQQQNGIILPDCAILADPGPDASFSPGVGVTLQGAATGHLPDATLQYAWAADPASDATDAMLSATDSAGPVFTMPAAAGAGQTFRFTLTVSDRQATSGSDDATVTFTPVGIVANPAALAVAEGGSDSYDLTLTRAPTSDVTVTVTGDAGKVIVSPASVTVTTSDWESARVVAVTGRADGDKNDETVTLRHVATPAAYTAMAGTAPRYAPVKVTVEDDEATVPGKPANFAAGAGNASARLRWDPPADSGGAPVTGYEYWRGTGTPRATENLSSHRVTGLTNGVEYTFQVRALNRIGAGAWSDEQTVAPVPLTLTVVAVDDEVTEGEPVRYRIVMSEPTDWVTVDETYRYQGEFLRSSPKSSGGDIRSRGGDLYWEIERATVDDGDIEAHGSFTVTLEPGDGYAVGAPSSATVRILDNDGGGLPGEPPDLAVRTVSATILEAAWGAVAENGAPLTGHEVAYREQNDTAWTLWPEEIGPSARSARLTGLSPATAYEVRARASNVRGMGPWSSVAEASTAPDPGVTVSIERASGIGKIEGDTLVFTVRASPAPESALLVDVRVTETLEMLPEDVPMSVTVPAGQDSVAFEVATDNDGQDEGDSEVTAELRPSARYTLGAPRAATYRVLDNERDDPNRGRVLRPRVETILDPRTPEYVQASARAAGQEPVRVLRFAWDPPSDVALAHVHGWEIQWAGVANCNAAPPAAETTWRNRGFWTVAELERIHGGTEMLHQAPRAAHFRVRAKLLGTTLSGPWSEPVCGDMADFVPAEVADAPVVTSVTVAADPDGDGKWSPGEAVTVTIEFSEAVTVRTGEGTPSVSLHAGGVRQAVYAGGSGTAVLRFVYEVTDADGAVNSVLVPRNSLRLNGGAIEGSAGQAAALGHDRAEQAETPAPRAPRTAARPPALSVADASAVEGGTLRFAVTLAPASADTVWVDWASADGTAAADADYEADSGRLIFRPGETSKTVRISARSDSETEGDETMTLTLSNASGAELADARATGTVSDRAGPPPKIAIADAAVKEGPGAVLAFRVTLDASSQAVATVDWETRDQSATAGADYEGGSGTLRFAPGQTSKTIRVAVHDDAEDEGNEHMLVVLSNAVGATLAQPVAGGRIENSDPMPRAWLARFGRTASVQAADAIRERLGGRESRTVENHFTVGGRRVDRMFGELRAAVSAGRGGPGDSNGAREPGEPDRRLEPESAWARMDRMKAEAMGWGTANGRAGGLANGGAAPGGAARSAGSPPSAGLGDVLSAGPAPVGLGGLMSNARPLADLLSAGPDDWTALLVGSSFDYSRSLDGGTGHGGGLSGWSAWGRGAETRFSGADGPLSIDGEVVTATVGTDAQWGRWLAGVAVSHSVGEGGYTHATAAGGEVTSRLTSLNPYANFDVNERINLWGTLGYGVGELSLAGARLDNPIETGLETTMAAFGGRGVFARPEGGLELAVVSDALISNAVSEVATGLMGAAGVSSRVRLMLEGSGSMPLPNGVVLRPTLEAGLRYDGGDAETGAGVEIGGGLAWSAGRWSVEMNARGLVAHEDAGYEEWGFSGSVKWQPNEDGRGWAMDVGSSWGAVQSGVQGLWSQADTSGFARGGAMDASQRLQAQLGYGLAGRKGRALWVPFFATEASARQKAYRMGLKFSSGPNLEAGLELGRRTGTRGVAEDAIELRGARRW